MSKVKGYFVYSQIECVFSLSENGTKEKDKFLDFAFKIYILGINKGLL